MIQQLINNTIVSEVKQGLIYTRLGDKDIFTGESYLDMTSFKNNVLYRANDLNMTVNEIIADFKKMNGL